MSYRRNDKNSWRRIGAFLPYEAVFVFVLPAADGFPKVPAVFPTFANTVLVGAVATFAAEWNAEQLNGGNTGYYFLQGKVSHVDNGIYIAKKPDVHIFQFPCIGYFVDYIRGKMKGYIFEIIKD